MNKFLIIPMIALLLVSTALAFSSVQSYRGDSGAVTNIGTDTNLIPSKISLSFCANHNLTSGSASLGVIARTTDGKRVVLNVNLPKVYYYFSSVNGDLIMNFDGIGTGNYWKQGIGLKSSLYSIHGEYNTNRGTTIIQGANLYGTTFNINNIKTVAA